MKTNIGNYRRAGGRGVFSDYYHADYESVTMNAGLRENITFANHNLVTDGVFSELHLILCRNVLIYFNGSCRRGCWTCFTTVCCITAFLHWEARNLCATAVLEKRSKNWSRHGKSTARSIEAAGAAGVGPEEKRIKLW